MSDAVHTLNLTWQQFDALEEAADIMCMQAHYVDTLEDAVHYLASFYVEKFGPQFEVTWIEEPEQTPEKV